MLKKFESPSRTHLLGLYASKGANFDPSLQDVAAAIPNVVTASAQATASI
jgi:hypothetical protein